MMNFTETNYELYRNKIFIIENNKIKTSLFETMNLTC